MADYGVLAVLFAGPVCLLTVFSKMYSDSICYITDGPTSKKEGSVDDKWPALECTYARDRPTAWLERQSLKVPVCLFCTSWQRDYQGPVGPSAQFP